MVAWIVWCVCCFTLSAVETMTSILNMDRGKQLTVDNINRNIAGIDCPVQGLIQQGALRVAQQLAQGVEKPFKDVLDATMGDASECGLTTLTFIRQVTAIACLPDLLSDSSFPIDVKTRAKDFLQNCQGNSIGSLTDTAGLERVRRHIATSARLRDTCQADWRDIIIVPGLSAAVKILFNLMNFTTNGLPVAAMVPVPEFSLFTGTLTEFSVKKVGYYLNEENGWSVDLKELERAILENKSESKVRAIMVINPGNPTGQVLKRKNIEDIVKFAHKENLLIIACELLQASVYDEHRFHSVKQVMTDMGAPHHQMELVSLVSCSKGYAEETGLRGGYLELYNISPSIKDFLKRHIMISDSPPVCTQIALDCITNPPQPGQPSYSLFHQERAVTLAAVSSRAKAMHDGINSIPGLSCHTIQGGFFAFVKVDIPEMAVEKAESLNLSPSMFYVLEMMENAGVMTLPGEGFGEKPGTCHFRITILLAEDKLKEAVKRIRRFHSLFMEQYQQQEIER